MILEKILLHPKIFTALLSHYIIIIAKIRGIKHTNIKVYYTKFHNIIKKDYNLVSYLYLAQLAYSSNGLTVRKIRIT